MHPREVVKRLEMALKDPQSETRADLSKSLLRAALILISPESLEPLPRYKINRENDTGAGDEGFYEWWEVIEVATGRTICKCDYERDAIGIRNLMEKQSDPKAGAVYGIIDPDYGRIFTIARLMAWNYGYSCSAQGSFTRDLDLLLVPWEETSRNSDLERLVKMLAEQTDLRILKGPSMNPHGRMTWTLMFPGFGDPRFVDVSGFPAPYTPEASVAEPETKPQFEEPSVRAGTDRTTNGSIGQP